MVMKVSLIIFIAWTGVSGVKIHTEIIPRTLPHNKLT